MKDEILELVRAATADLKGQANLMVARGLVVAANDGNAIQTMQATFLAEEPADEIERIQEYGFSSVPDPGAEVVAAFVGGRRDHGVVVAVDDRRYRIKGLANGDVAVYDKRGQSVLLTDAGILINGAGRPMKIFNTPEIDMDTPLVKMSGDLQVAGDVTAGGDVAAGGDVIALGDVKDRGTKSMASMRNVYNIHDHLNPEGGRVGRDQGQM